MIRIAAESDIPRLMDIYNYAILHTTATFDTEIKDYADRRDWFFAHQGRHILLVHEKEGVVTGYASLSRYRDRKAFDGTVEISVYLHPDFHGQGIGSALMEKILDFARSCDEINTVVSLITGSNTVSIHMHEKFGFAYCGQIRHAGKKFGKILDLNIYEIVYKSGS